MFKLFKPKTRTVCVPLGVLSVLWRTPHDIKNGIRLREKIAGQGQHTEDSQPFATDRVVQPTTISFSSREIEDFYGKFIAPSIRGQPFNIIIKLLGLLDEKGACPSVVNGDDETPEEYRCLTSVTLTEHALNVARKGFNMLNTGRRIIRNSTPDVLIAALSHDIGKIPGLAGNDVRGHTFGSIAFLRPLLTSLEPGKKILKAVRLLHVQEKDRKGGNKDLSLLQILQQADREARQAEVKAVQAEPAAQPNICEGRPKSGTIVEARAFAKERLLQALKPLLLKDVYESFILKDKVFVSPVFLKQVATSLAEGGDNQDFFESCTEKELVGLIGWSEAIPTFMVRFYKRASKPVTRQYVSLEKHAFGDLSGLKQREKAQGVRKVVCIRESGES